MNLLTPVKVLIADDHPLIREGLAALIQRRDDMLLVGEASNGQEAVERFAQHNPDVTLMDLRMPVMDGIAAIASIRELSPQARIIVLTNFDGDQDIWCGLQAGAKAYLLKDAPKLEVLETIRQVAQGQTCIPSAVAAKLAQRMNQPELTSRELEVLHRIACGYTNQEVATRLFIAEGTVKAHVNSILSKMGVSDRTAAVTQAIRRGMVQLS